MTRIILAIVLGFLAGSLSDWLFMGVLFHERYKSFPEVWRGTSNETQKILIAQLFSVLTAFGFVVLAINFGPFDLSSSLALAALIWLIGPLPLLLSNHLFIKLDPLVTTSHAAGWLVKLLLIAGISALIL